MSPDAFRRPLLQMRGTVQGRTSEDGWKHGVGRFPIRKALCPSPQKAFLRSILLRDPCDLTV
jgi:hypothetical protein